MDLKRELEIAKRAAFIAGEKILEVYKSGNFQVEFKEKGSPVGLADRLSNVEICKILHKEFPDYGIISEEKVEEKVLEEIPTLSNVLGKMGNFKFSWIIDPLDGTKYFIERKDTFGIHIGLVHKGKAVLGINYYPLKKIVYFAIKGKGSYLQKGKRGVKRICTSKIADLSKFKIVTDKKIPFYLKELIKEKKLPRPFRINGTGIKICKIAEGIADLYTCLEQKTTSGVCIWDICSCSIILEEAGGKITDLYGEPINFFQEHPELRRGAIASNGRISHKEISIFIENYVI